MERALQGILVAGEARRDEVLNGNKTVTIMYGHRDYTLGPVLIVCDKLNWAKRGIITNVRHTVLAGVTDDEMKSDGFESFDEMLFESQKLYPDIHANSNVTVITWKLV